jgi:hypothetical protein
VNNLFFGKEVNFLFVSVSFFFFLSLI